MEDTLHCLLVGQWGCRIHHLGGSSHRACHGLWMKVPCWGWLRARPTPRLKEPRERKVPLIRVQHPQNHLSSCWEGEGRAGRASSPRDSGLAGLGCGQYICMSEKLPGGAKTAGTVDRYISAREPVTMQDYDRKRGVHVPLMGSAPVYSSSSLRSTECPVGPTLSGTRDRAHH